MSVHSKVKLPFKIIVITVLNPTNIHIPNYFCEIILKQFQRNQIHVFQMNKKQISKTI